NALHGISVSNATPVLNDCTITDNNQSGAHCRKLAYPRFTSCAISGNRVGVHSDTGSTPSLGDDMYPETGHNSITGNQMAAIANYNGTENPVFARRNWWGAAPPSGRVFLGYVLWQPYLTAPDGETVMSAVDDRLPLAFELKQNAPNPFNPVTVLSYAVPAPGTDVEVAVYDVSGRPVAVLSSGHHSAGRYTAVWDARDDNGHRVASGVYFARMVTLEYVTQRKMILLK
ncbi:T9SS type A sorting domain-containing protein, partial [bacterium]|nr:T9SS type A sorting domain-containing protein [bacterium]